ncbi:endonuclease [Psychroflexus sediminis]|uniref:Por secretion system C-terminal sorting domain-containing protein n=1 Tax=Psychroflexus sediminis TaxID=470826 RepID=A0A1G7XDP4_9FLAO|nr:endonuclease [Psychroflexus sediminis]SDG82405.1 Por secretion system C-terminal sorting domain-containing protein [Psychroflexus sediminis]
MTKNYKLMWKSILLGILTFSFYAVQAQAPAGYYSLAEGKTGEALKSSLYEIIKNHVEFPYTSSSTDVWDILKETDRDPNNPNNVVGIYSNFSMTASLEYNSGDGWNREHVWAKSKGDFGTNLGAGTDVHHLRAADISTNSARNNRTFAEATDPYVDGSGTYQGTTGSYTSSTEFVWEPRAEVKGDVARMIFYMATRYEGFNGEPDLELVDYVVDASDKSPLHGKLSDLLAWHAADPVDDLEKQRNDIIYTYQQNRNPYIDHPEYVESIWGGATDPALAITSTPVDEVTVNTTYTYNITASGGETTVSFDATQKPSWLTFTDNNDGTAILTGTPTEANTGTYAIDINATNGTENTSQAFTLSVSALASGDGYATDLLISEYIEGSSYNKVLEIANFTGSDVDLSAYTLHKQTNGSGDWSTGLNLTGILPQGEVYVIAHPSASSEIIIQADLTSGSSELNFNGNDAVALFKSGNLLDIVGVFNDGTNFAKDVTLVRKSSVTSPTITYDVNEWDTYTKDTFTYLGGHTFSSAVNEAPSVSITSPTTNSAFTEGDIISIEASATDADGSVTKVVFYEGSNVLGEDDSSPYALDWTTSASGSFSLTALVYDDKNTTSMSEAVAITIESSSNTPDLFFSEYIEGSSYNKALEIANQTGSDVDLSAYSVHKQTNGAGDWSTGLNLTGTLAQGEVYVIAHSSASFEILAQADIDITSSEINFNGNDAVALFKSGELLDIIGVFNDDSYFAKDVTLLRKSDITSPRTIYDVNEWDTYAKDTFGYLGNATLSTFGTNAAKDKLIFYPNPFQNTARLKFGSPEASEVLMTIYTLTGQKIESHSYPKNRYTNEIRLGTELSKGIYILEVVIDGIPQRMKIIKE